MIELEEVGAPPAPSVSDETVLNRLKELLKDADLQTTTEKMLRKQLEKEFQQDLTSKKKLIRAEVERYLDETAGEAADGEDAEEGADGDGGDGDASDGSDAKAPRSGAGLGNLLSPQMQAFLGQERMARPQVVKAIWAHIKANNLQDPKNRRNILLDDKLKTIFTPPVNIFSMNKQLSRHVKTADAGSRVRPKPAAKAAVEPVAKPAAKRAKTEGGGGGGNGGGFMRPVTLAPALAEFVGASEMTRAELTKFFNAYFTEHGLKDPKDKRFVLADERLQTLLGEERFLAFGIQRLLKPLIL